MSAALVNYNRCIVPTRPHERSLTVRGSNLLSPCVFSPSRAIGASAKIAGGGKDNETHKHDDHGGGGHGDGRFGTDQYRRPAQREPAGPRGAGHQERPVDRRRDRQPGNQGGG